MWKALIRPASLGEALQVARRTRRRRPHRRWRYRRARRAAARASSRPHPHRHLRRARTQIRAFRTRRNHCTSAASPRTTTCWPRRSPARPRCRSPKHAPKSARRRSGPAPRSPGNLATASPANDTIAPLTVPMRPSCWSSAAGERTLPIAAVLYRVSGHTCLRPDELIREIRFPALDAAPARIVPQTGTCAARRPSRSSTSLSSLAFDADGRVTRRAHRTGLSGADDRPRPACRSGTDRPAARCERAAPPPRERAGATPHRSTISAARPTIGRRHPCRAGLAQASSGWPPARSPHGFPAHPGAARNRSRRAAATGGAP